MKMVIKIVIALIIAIVIFGGYIFFIKKEPNVKFDDKVVEGIKFSDFTYDYDNKISKVRLNITNTTAVKIDVKNVVIQFYKENKSLIASSTTTLNISLEPGGVSNIYAEVYTNISDIKQIDYTYTK